MHHATTSNSSSPLMHWIDVHFFCCFKQKPDKEEQRKQSWIAAANTWTLIDLSCSVVELTCFWSSRSSWSRHACLWSHLQRRRSSIGEERDPHQILNFSKRLPHCASWMSWFSCVEQSLAGNCVHEAFACLCGWWCKQEENRAWPHVQTVASWFGRNKGCMVWEALFRACTSIGGLIPRICVTPQPPTVNKPPDEEATL